MLERRNHRKGSISVFLVLVLGSMILLAFAVHEAAVRATARSAGEAALVLAARSVLSEYDKPLFERYGILAFRGSPEDLRDGLRHYAAATLESSPYYHLEGLRAESGDYALILPDAFESAVLEWIPVVLAGMAESALGAPEADKGVPGPAGTCEDRVLKNRSVSGSLPSRGAPDPGGILGRLKDIKNSWQDAFRKGTDNFLVNQYIDRYFSSAANPPGEGETFFRNEVEYILEGRLSDRQNRVEYRGELLVLRNAVNAVFLVTDAVKMSQLAAAAQLLTPGPEAFLTQIVLAEAWALAEAENDILLLEHGCKVPFVKTAESWAVDLDSVLSGTSRGYIDTHCASGLDYRGYLQLFLFFMDRETKLYRMMDLIQLNLQGGNDRSFLIREHQTGVYYESEVNGVVVRGQGGY
jgi:hypothetical protein